MKFPIVCPLVLLFANLAAAQKMNVRIVDRQDKEDGYDYAAVYNNVAVGRSYRVHGATLTLGLPDGRLAVVNCESKFAEHFAGRAGNVRSCRTPIVDEIETEFHGGNAKLIWSVSLDGRKMQSETYRILGVLDPKPNTTKFGVLAPEAATSVVAAPVTAPAPLTNAAVPQTASLLVESSVPNCDIEIDGDFVGNTPSTLTVAPGKHAITVKKTGYADWTRNMTVATGNVRLSAEMVAK